MTRTLNKTWDSLWFSRFDPATLCLCRVVLGMNILLWLIHLFPNWDRFFAADGILSLNDADLDSTRVGRNWWCIFNWTEGLVPMMAWWWICFFCAMAFTLGLRTRIATIALLVLITSIVHRSWFVGDGHISLYRLLLFFMCFAPMGACYSLDRLIRSKQDDTADKETDDPLPLVWPIRLMQINFLFLYVLSLPEKLMSGEDWRNGQAVYYAMANDFWSRDWPMIFHQYGSLLSKITTYGTIVIEIAVPILICFKKTRLFAIAMGLCFHVVVATMIENVGFFTLSIIMGYCLFLPPELVRRWLSFGEQSEAELSETST